MIDVQFEREPSRAATLIATGTQIDLRPREVPLEQGSQTVSLIVDSAHLKVEGRDLDELSVSSFPEFERPFALSSATVSPLSKGFLLFTMTPVVEFGNIQAQALSDRMREILQMLVPFMNQYARAQYIPVERVEINEFVDPEEDWWRLTITQCLDVPAQTALEYWDEIVLVVDDFISQLPPGLSGIAKDQITVEVFWKDDQPLLFTDAF